MSSLPLGSDNLDRENPTDVDISRYTQPKKVDVLPRTDPLVKTGKICPYCEGQVEYMDSAAIYNGRSYGMIFCCLPCHAYTGTKPGKNDDGEVLPVGSVARKPLIKARKKAREAFDLLWKAKMRRDKVSADVAREAGYRWLRERLNFPEDWTIELMGEEDCKRTIELCNQYESAGKKYA